MSLLTVILIDGKPLRLEVTEWIDDDLKGNPIFKVEDSVSEGYMDISSITNWDLFGLQSGKDFKFIRYEIYLLRALIGYDKLSLEEKIITNKYFVSGVEYFNSEVTSEQQDAFFLNFLKPNADEARKKRDVAITKYMVKQLYTGKIPQSSIDQLIIDSEGMRTQFLRCGTQGIGYGDTIDGVINFVKNDSSFSPFDIINVDTVLKTFSVSGDKTSKFTVDKIIRIHNSTGNDNGYTVISFLFDNTNTNIVVKEKISSSIADGSIYINGLLCYEGLTIGNQNDVFDIYWNGNY